MRTGKPATGFGVRATGIYLTLLAFLLPLKFGSLAAMTDAAGFFPADFFSWMFVTFPAHSVAFFAVAGIAAAMLTLPWPSWRSEAGLVAALWALAVPLAALPGIVGGDPEFALGEISHFLGVGCYALAVFALVSAAPKWGGRLAAALCTAAVLVAILALRQYFFGFEEMKKFIADQQAAGIELGKSMYYKLTDTRVYSTFVSSNALAGFLLLILFTTIRNFRLWGARFEPRELSMRLFAAASGALLLAALALTRARSAWLCLAVIGFGFGFSLRWQRKWKLAGLAGLIVLLLIGAILTVRLGRGSGSMAERADYLRTSVVMFMEKPLTGHGWGGFFYRHMRIKTTSTDEAARDPHNILAAFSVQCGALSGLIVLAALALPLLKLWRRRRDGFTATVFWGGAAFSIHMLMDSDMQIPGLLCSLLTLYLAALTTGNGARPASGPFEHLCWLIPVAVLCTAALWSNSQWLKGEIAFARLTEHLNPSSVGERTAAENRPRRTILREAAKAKPHSATVWEMAGDRYLREHDFLTAEECYKEALKINPRRPGVYRRLAELEMRIGNAKNAAELMRRAHELFPRNPLYSMNELYGNPE